MSVTPAVRGDPTVLKPLKPLKRRNVVGIPSPFASKSDWGDPLERGFVKAQGPPALALARGP